MGLEAGMAAMEEGLSGGEATSSSESAPEVGNTPQSETSSPSIQDIIDLDKVEKFKLNGEEWTREKLASAMFRQADYTRKTQDLSRDRESFEKEKKFSDNLAYDIANVLKNPALLTRFKETYPERFHQYLKPYESYLRAGQTESGESQGEQKARPDPQLLTRIDQIEGKFRQQEVKAAEVMLDGIFKQYSEKFPFADEASVISKSLALMEQKKNSGGSEDLTQEEWNRVFQSEHDRVFKLAEAKYKETVSKQLKANRKAKDVGTGGDAVGQAPKRLSMKEATEAAIRDLGGR